MTPDYQRQWRERGDLFDCPNPPHDFEIGPWAGQWRWASSCWSSISVTGTMANYGLCFCTIKTLEGHQAYKVVIWRLSVIWGLKA